MKPNELRVNNWYNSTKFQTPVICEFADFAELSARADGAKVDEDLIDDMFEPIPLTEEWLLKFGFEKRKKLLGLLVFSKSGFDLHFVNGKWEFYVMGSSCILTEIEYVHQLQSIYFALKGEALEKELNLK